MLKGIIIIINKKTQCVIFFHFHIIIYYSCPEIMKSFFFCSSAVIKYPVKRKLGGKVFIFTHNGIIFLQEVGGSSCSISAIKSRKE